MVVQWAPTYYSMSFPTFYTFCISFLTSFVFVSKWKPCVQSETFCCPQREKGFSLQYSENTITRWSTIFDVLSITFLSQWGSSQGQGAVLGSRNISVSVFNQTQ